MKRSEQVGSVDVHAGRTGSSLAVPGVSYQVSVQVCATVQSFALGAAASPALRVKQRRNWPAQSTLRRLVENGLPGSGRGGGVVESSFGHCATPLASR